MIDKLLDRIIDDTKTLLSAVECEDFDIFSSVLNNRQEHMDELLREYPHFDTSQYTDKITKIKEIEMLIEDEMKHLKFSKEKELHNSKVDKKETYHRQTAHKQYAQFSLKNYQSSFNKLK